VTWWLPVAILVACGVGIWLGSLLLEAARPVPPTPRTLFWAPDIAISYVEVDGSRLRYIKAGKGPNLLLLHTLRTQLDLFQKVVPELATSFTVYALDYPGHGYSDIPRARYDADFFARSIDAFLSALDLHDVTACGVSIGGSIALILAGRNNPRVCRVIAINPYDYASGRGLARSGLAGWVTMATAGVPVIGETFNRLRSFAVVKAVLLGGVASPENFPPGLAREMYTVGNRRGHYRAFVSLLRHAGTWEAATQLYRHIAVPTRLVWGDRDWSRPVERECDRQLVAGGKAVMVERGGHFLPLDRPDAVIEQVKASAPMAADQTN
jgi:pimeloyl-ACP methyl ester carboxylesterase